MKDNQKQSIVKVEKTIVSFAGYKIDIHKKTAKLLFLSDKDHKHVSFGVGISVTIDLLNGQVDIKDLTPEDPSMIYIRMPIRKPLNIDKIPRPNYYPTYAGLTPEQKWIYLNWLRDLSRPVNIGYVFIYYYGLERQLLIGDFDSAFDEILFLRKYHQNSSFVSYSNSALLHSCIFRKRRDRLEEVYKLRSPDKLENIDLLIAHQLDFDLSAKNLIAASKNIRDINRRYIKSNKELFETVLEECLRQKYGNIHFPLASRYKISDLPKRQDILFANFSFPSEIRTPEIPNFFEHFEFTNEIKALFSKAHEKVKLILKNQRRSKN